MMNFGIIFSEVPYKEIGLALLGSVSAYLIWKVQHQKDKIKDIENQLSDKKYNLYIKVLYLFFDVAYGEKVGKPISDIEVKKRILEVKKDMFLYATDDIFRGFTNWALELKKPGGNINHFKIYFKMLLLIRKDMGKSDTKITLDDFMLFYMQDEEEYAKFKKQHGW